MNIGLRFFLIGVFFLAFAGAEECCLDLPDFCDLTPPWSERITLDLALLYQKVDSDGFEYIVTKRFKAGRLKQKYKCIDLGWAPGYRIGFNWEPAYFNWKWGFHWTHYDVRSSNSEKVKGGFAFSIPIVNNVSEVVLAGEEASIRARLKARFEIYDFELSQWCNCACMDFRPIIGVRLADIHENLKMYNILGPDFSIHTMDWHIKNEFKGIGFKAGFESRYPFSSEWSVTGGMEGAIMWGNTEYRNKYTTLFSSAQIVRETIRENRRLIRPMLDLHAGLEWCCEVCDCNFLRIKAEWEFHCIFNQWRYLVSNVPTDAVLGSKTRSHLFLQGLCLTGSFEY